MLTAIVILILLFITASIGWIVITPYTLDQFNIVLSKILKASGTYSTLLVGLVITIFYQRYIKEKEREKEEEIKVGEVGYYTLAFQRKEDDYTEAFSEMMKGFMY